MKNFTFLFLTLTACAPLSEYLGQKPEEVTVEDALIDIGQGLTGFKNTNVASGSNYGLLVDEVTVTLNVKASRSGSNKLVIDSSDISPPAVGLGQVAVNSTSDRSGENTRSNVIVLKLKNRYTATLNTVGTTQVAGEPVTTLGIPQVILVNPSNPFLTIP